ncbi:hypothetical protein B484DRAFT_463264, partial [Ochromonadaceae sp. CCMP2298]
VGGARSSSAPASYSSSTGTQERAQWGSVQVRLPKPAVLEGEQDRDEDRGDGRDRARDRDSCLDVSGDFTYGKGTGMGVSPGALGLGISPVAVGTSYLPSYRASPASPGVDIAGRGGGGGEEMQGALRILEDEFNQLSIEYRRLLSSVQPGSVGSAVVGNGTHDIVRVPSPTTAESVQAQAEEIVAVIQKLHRKGEQLRALKGTS